MKNYSINPTDKNAIEMFRSDAIGRNKEIVRFINLLDAISNGCAIALDGEWGNGKTFFIKQTKLIMDYSNSFSDIEEETRNDIESALSAFEYRCSESYATVYYDAWANDNTEDPILSLIYTAMKDNQTKIKPENKVKLSEVFTAILDVVTGRNISTLCEKARGDDLFESIKKEGDIQLLVKDFVQALIEERANQLVIFIDESDRCKPEYAMQLLERIKHYFDDERIIFVFSVNLSQLQHTVKSYYGAEFDATRYLNKFFDLRVSLSKINYDSYIEKRFSFIRPSFFHGKICVDTVKHFRLTLRETERFMRLIRIANQGDHYGPGRPSEMAYQFAHIFFVPILIGLSMTDIEAYRRFISGDDPSCSYEILLESKKALKNYLLGANEYFTGDEAEAKGDYDVAVRIDDRINAVYAELFPKISYQHGPAKHIGQMEFSSRTRDEIHEIISLLSPVCDYDFK